MLGSEGPFSDYQGAPGERLGFRITALGSIEFHQVAENGGSGRIIWAIFFRHQSQGFLGVGFGLRVAALLE